jgi:hypothetical protein
MITQRVFRTGAAVLFAAALAAGAGKPPVGGAPPPALCYGGGAATVQFAVRPERDYYHGDLRHAIGRRWQWHAIIGHNYT